MMIELLVTVTFGIVFMVVSLLINAMNENPLRLKVRGVRLLAVVAMLIGCGLYQVSAHFYWECGDTSCGITWGDPQLR